MCQEEYQETISESSAFHPGGNVTLSRQTELSAQQSKQLSSSAVAVAVALVSLDQRNNQRNKKAKQAQPGKQDIEESQNQIGEGCNPEIVVPVFFLLHGFSS